MAPQWSKAGCLSVKMVMFAFADIPNVIICMSHGVMENGRKMFKFQFIIHADIIMIIVTLLCETSHLDQEIIGKSC